MYPSWRRRYLRLFQDNATEIDHLSDEGVRQKFISRYICRNHLLSRKYREVLRLLEPDAETVTFLRTCKRDGAFRTMQRSILGYFYSKTDANAILKTGEMFVLSAEQCSQLLAKPLPPPPLIRPGPSGSLLDIGSGDGHATATLASLFATVVTTETSDPMVKRLRARGWRCEHTNTLVPFLRRLERFDAVSLLNVLDRASHPVQLLKQIQLLLRPNGVFLLAVVLPFCPFVEDGTKKKNPTETLPLGDGFCNRGASFEYSLECLCSKVLEPMGFRILSVSKVPYISKGDYKRPYYILHDAIIVMKLQDQPTTCVPVSSHATKVSRYLQELREVEAASAETDSPTNRRPFSWSAPVSSCLERWRTTTKPDLPYTVGH